MRHFLVRLKPEEWKRVHTYDYSSFETYPSWNNWWKIKPNSQKPLVKEDLVIYCTECGSKRKKDNHNFCPHCGTKY
jgi:DNA-directed RNA polymerase subunit RPC12/RpoP